MGEETNGQLLLSLPGRLLRFLDSLVFKQCRQRDRASGRGEVERGICRQAKEGAELAGEFVGKVVPGVFPEKEMTVWRPGEVGGVGDGATELGDLFHVAGLEGGEVGAGIGEGGLRVGLFILAAGEEPDVLQPDEVEFEVAASIFESSTVGAGPVYCWLEVGLLFELAEDVVHFIEGGTELFCLGGGDAKGFFNCGGCGIVVVLRSDLGGVF